MSLKTQLQAGVRRHYSAGWLHGHEVRLNLHASSCGPTEPELNIGFHAAQAPIYAVSMHSAVDCTTEITHEKPSMRGAADTQPRWQPSPELRQKVRGPYRIVLRFAAEHGMNGAVQETFMTEYPILFNLTPDDLRRIGARGGRAHARNWRARQRAAVVAPVAPPTQRPRETTAQAIAALEAQFPWLRQP